ncbi:MAG: hypothetical protein KAY32_08990 [Candidatus Eisenbacteria sp.]|nr:hypothetical protein [Candidatus Eisenbacteria bacterium]
MNRRKQPGGGFWQAPACVLGALVVTYLVFAGPWGCSPEDSSWETAQASAQRSEATTEPMSTATTREAPAAPAGAETDSEASNPRAIFPAPPPEWNDREASRTGSAMGEPARQPGSEMEDSDLADPRAAAIAAAKTAWARNDAIGALDRLDPWLGEDLGADGHFVAGSALLAIEETAAARDHLERAALADPGGVAVWSTLARAHLKAQAPQLAYRAAHRALRLDRKHDPAWIALGLALLDLHRGDEALGAFESAVAIDPQNTEGWNGIGLIWLLREEFVQARAALEMAIAAPSCPAHAHNNLGLVYERLGFAEWADREYARCLELDPEHPTAALSRQRIAPFLAIRATR